MDTDGLKKLLSVEKIDCHGCSGRWCGKEMAADFSRPWNFPGRGICEITGPVSGPGCSHLDGGVRVCIRRNGADF